jgi:flagellar L-ring protein precursor FlgH
MTIRWDRRYWRLLFLLLAAVPPAVRADDIWDRRSPYVAYMFQDYRARKVGDVLTILVEELTGSDAQEKREMDKKTASGMAFDGNGSSSSLGQALRSFAYDLELNSASNRKFDGKANSTIDRKFTDRLSVIVVAVLPNGNLVVEGTRQRMITREMRTLRVFAIVRPADIGPYNTIPSQYLANLRMYYEGRGPESSYTNQGWGGRIINKLWPF